MILHTGGGKVTGTEVNVTALTRMQPQVPIGVPGYVYHILRQARTDAVKLTNLQLIALGGERVSGPRRARLGEMCAQMGVPRRARVQHLRLHRGEAVLGGAPLPDYPTSYGFHTYPELEVFELVDPDTGEPVGPGERGELVYTALEGRGSCVLRYRTGDIAETGIVHDPCPGCGRITARISTTLSRRSDVNELNLTKIRGTLVDLNNFLPSMAGIPDVLEWQLVLKKHNDDPNDLDELVLYIAVAPHIDHTAIKEKVAAKLLNDTEVSPNHIEVLPLAQLEEHLGLDTQMKELRIRDLRGHAKAFK